MMKTSLFTIIVEYAGGTYISQVLAQGPENAMSAWIAAQSNVDLTAWRLDRSKLMAHFARQSPATLRGMKNVWCGTASFSEGLLLANIVRTVS
jgi:hypothetical protein